MKIIMLQNRLSINYRHPTGLHKFNWEQEGISTIIDQNIFIFLDMFLSYQTLKVKTINMKQLCRSICRR